MRVLAFALLACAAFAWTPPFLDRAGTAALGLAFAALAIGTIRAPRERRLPFRLRPDATAATPTGSSSMSDLVERVSAYALDDPSGVGVPRPDLTHP